MILALLFTVGLLLGGQALRVPVPSRSFARVGYRTMSNGENEVDPILTIAKSFVSSDFGVTRSSLLAKNFTCSGPSFRGVSKQSYMTGLTIETKAFEAAVPDFALQSYDFVVDNEDKDTVWFKIRPCGTVTGPFAYRGEAYLPNNKAFQFPVQQMSATIKNGKVARVTAGYVVDRLSGTTGGLPGPLGILYVLGEVPSSLSYLPPLVALKRFFGRNRRPITKKVKNSPFLEAVMLSLAKAIVESDLGLADESLLSADFQYSDPLMGPLTKEEYLSSSVGTIRSVKEAGVSDYQLNAYNYAIDPFEPDRVWAVARPTGSRRILVNSANADTGGAEEEEELAIYVYEGPPEAISVSFDKKGLCYRVTAGYSLDREQGNGRGLAGVYGALEATKQPQFALETRPVTGTVYMQT